MVSLNAGCGEDGWGDVRLDLRGTPLVFANIEFLPFRANVFSKIKLREVLEHLDSPLRGLLELKRVLRGSMYISIPNVYYYRVLLRTVQKGWKIPVNYRTDHLQAWDVITMKQLLYQAGLSMVRGRFGLGRRYLEVTVD